MTRFDQHSHAVMRSRAEAVTMPASSDELDIEFISRYPDPSRPTCESKRSRKQSASREAKRRLRVAQIDALTADDRAWLASHGWRSPISGEYDLDRNC